MPDPRGIYSSSRQLTEIETILRSYLRLPFTSINIPGAILEGVLGHVRGAEVRRTYEFIDILDSKNRVGWQIKSTLAETPVTWKRAKIPDALELIAASARDDEGLSVLGDAIISFCNKHAENSLSAHNLKEIGYARLIVHKDGRATYFERLLCSKEKPELFDPSEFSWKWSSPKKTRVKEQLPALHGIHRPSGKKWFAWHGKGENQLHFSGEAAWWPKATDVRHVRRFQLPSQADKLSIEQFIDVLTAPSNPLRLS